MNYEEFLKQKDYVVESSGFEVDKSEINPMLYEFQKDIVRWALAKGRACVFADCGLGKTPCQLSWAYHVHKHTNGKILILAPLAVTEQTAREAVKFGYVAKVCESQDDCIDGINITNYEKLDKFVANEFVGVVLDESSILKSYTGKVRTAIIEYFRNVPYKLACTATPAPNDYMELGNHAEFIGVMSRSEMLATFFVHDGGNTSKWRLKNHAKDVFWQWMASWSVFVDNPRNLGYDIDDIAGCLRTLSIAEYSQTLVDRDDFNPPLLYVFGKMVEGRTIYIKLKIKSENKKVVCVSFHYAEYDMNYPYR